MKNVIKKISAFAMAITLLGAGSAVTEFAEPQANNTIIASAAYQSDVTKVFRDVNTGDRYVPEIQFVYDNQ